MTVEQQNLVNCIHTLILTRSNNLYIDGFSNNDINYIIDYLLLINVISCLYINMLLSLIILINVIDTRYDVCLHNIIGTQLTVEQQNLVNCIHTLILTRSNNLYIDGLSHVYDSNKINK